MHTFCYLLLPTFVVVVLLVVAVVVGGKVGIVGVGGVGCVVVVVVDVDVDVDVDAVVIVDPKVSGFLGSVVSSLRMRWGSIAVFVDYVKVCMGTREK